MRLSEKDVLACAALADDIRSVRQGDGLFPARLHEGLVDLLGARCSGAYTLQVADGAVQVDALTTHNVSSPLVQSIVNENLAAKGRQGPFIQLRPPRAQRNRAVLLSELEPNPRRLAKVRAEAGLDRMQLGGADQVRVLVCDGSAFQAFVGAYREEPFSARQRQLLAGLTPALIERTRLLSRLPLSQLTFSALETVFENAAAASGLVNGAGGVVLGNARLRESAIEWRAPLLAAIKGDRSTFSVTPVDAAGVPRHYLVRQLDVTTRVSDAFARRYRLSPREREVLEHLAAGRSNAAIAVLLVCSVRTAEAHVAHVLAKTNTGARTEVIDLLLREGT